MGKRVNLLLCQSFPFRPLCQEREQTRARWYLALTAPGRSSDAPNHTSPHPPFHSLRRPCDACVRQAWPVGSPRGEMREIQRCRCIQHSSHQRREITTPGRAEKTQPLSCWPRCGSFSLSFETYNLVTSTPLPANIPSGRTQPRTSPWQNEVGPAPNLLEGIINPTSELSCPEQGHVNQHVIALPALGPS